jgi:hypothetical protein
MRKKASKQDTRLVKPQLVLDDAPRSRIPLHDGDLAKTTLALTVKSGPNRYEIELK